MLMPVESDDPALNYDADFVGVAHSVVPNANDVISSQFVRLEHFPAVVLDEWEESLFARGVYAEGRRALLSDGRVVLLPRTVLAAVIAVNRLED